jgi:hypothetical protein
MMVVVLGLGLYIQIMFGVMILSQKDSQAVTLLFAKVQMTLILDCISGG